MYSFLLEEDPRPENKEGQEIIVIKPLPTEISTHLTSFPSYCYVQAIFSTPSSISSTTTTTTTVTLPTPSFQDSFENFSSLHFPVHSILDSSSTSPSSPPSYSDSLSSLVSHTSIDMPASSSSYILTSPLPSSLPPSYPIYRPLPIYASSRSSNFTIGSVPYLYSSVLSTNTLSLSHHGSSSTRVFSTSSRPTPSGPKKRATRNWSRDWLRSCPRDNTYYTTRRQCPRPVISGSFLSSNTASFPLLSSWANPSSY